MERGAVGSGPRHHERSVARGSRARATTFLFTDVEGSTRLWADDEEAMADSMRRHDGIVRSVLDWHRGAIFSTAGDSFGAAFESARDAVQAARSIQDQLSAADWPGPRLSVRIGLHLGEAEMRGNDYFGVAVNTAARVEDAGHGGQVLITEAVLAAAETDAIDLGVHHLRDVPEGLRLYQVGGGSFPPLRVLDPHRSNLPARPTSLIGRSVEVASVRRLLLRSRLVTLVSIGGQGKTRLAIAIGEAELFHRRDGVWFVDLTSVRDGGDVALASAKALGLHLTRDDPIEQVVRYLSEKSALVILDNCEHVIEDCARFADRFLRTTSDSALLATSREALAVDGEQLMPLGPLATDDVNAPGVRVFIERATAANPGFHVSDKDESVVREICEQLDGMPLAIELAAARTTVMSPREILAGLADRFSLLTSRRRQRHRTLRHVLDWSYEQFDARHQHAFRTTAVFVDGFDLDAFAAVIDGALLDAADAMEVISSKSLVEREDVDGRVRFRLLETVKAYADDQLGRNDEDDVARRHHARHFHALAAADGPVVQGLLGVGDRLRRDVGNLTAAHEWLTRNESPSASAEILLGGSMAFLMSSRVVELHALLSDAIETNGPDTVIADHLRTHQLTTSGIMSDAMALDALTTALIASTQSSFRAIGHCGAAILDTLIGRDGATAHLDHAERELQGVPRSTNVASAGEYAWRYAACCRMVRAFIGGDHAAAVAHSEEVLGSRDSCTDEWTFLQVGASTTGAMSRILLGEPSKALESIAWVDRFHLPMIDGTEIKALAHLEMADLDRARPLVRSHARRAADGKDPGEPFRSVLVLAALSRFEGDDERARELLFGIGHEQLPTIVAYSARLAAALDVSAREVRAVRSAQAPPDPTHERARVLSLLREELSRRGWD